MKVLCGKACTEELEATAQQFGWEESDCEWERVVEHAILTSSMSPHRATFMLPW